MDKKEILKRLNEFSVEIEDLEDNRLKDIHRIIDKLTDKFNDFIQEIEDDYLQKEKD